ncbi:hypothetical protein, partial [Chromobacterium haemolyticum]|uniref:hypothetical protein n=1 Tax=Chromobacterium haemolyticum TaxID=394935 RepID=UPI001EE662B2
VGSAGVPGRGEYGLAGQAEQQGGEGFAHVGSFVELPTRWVPRGIGAAVYGGLDKPSARSGSVVAPYLTNRSRWFFRGPLGGFLPCATHGIDTTMEPIFDMSNDFFRENQIDAAMRPTRG